MEIPSGQQTRRRKLISGLTVGIAGASQLPTQWTKPVVNSVLLPAHAQTSVTTTAGPTTTPGPGTTTTTPCPLTQLTIPGGSVSCQSSENRTETFGIIFAANGCAVDVGSGNDVSIRFFSNPAGNAFIAVTVAGTEIRANTNCVNFPPNPRTESGSPTFTASDGSTWQADVSITRDTGGNVTLDTITLTKL